jgi:hypothetical protein
MTTTIKITELSDIGANLSSSTVLPVVDMTGTPTTQKTIVILLMLYLMVLV